MKLSGPVNAARSVSSARSSGTEYAKVSGISPSGAHPRHTGVTLSPVVPSTRRGSWSVVLMAPPLTVGGGRWAGGAKAPLLAGGGGGGGGGRGQIPEFCPRAPPPPPPPLPVLRPAHV